MARVTRDVTIDAPVEEVFAFHTDPRNIRRISVNTERYKVSGPMGPNMTISGVTRVMGRTVSWDAEVVEFVPLRAYKLASTRSAVPWSIAYDYQAVDAGTTKVTCTQIAVKLDGMFGRLCDNLIAHSYARDLEANLANLKSLVETGVAVREPRTRKVAKRRLASR